ncbi:MAG: hypothetical protein HXY53_00430 [Nitrospirae bacterium]|nr:hypothetical protein [Nitrospirota bacterium]
MRNDFDIILEKTRKVGDNMCPYSSFNICTASISSMFIDNQIKSDCCETENYDSCPLFLSKVLRKS